VSLSVLLNESGGTATLHPTSSPTYTIVNGNNFASLLATGGDTISSVTISLPAGEVFSDLQSVRISGLTKLPGDPPAVVPEASTLVVWLMLFLPGAFILMRWPRRE
jgi:hypothetical protein